jgi:hypothetical protein
MSTLANGSAAHGRKRLTQIVGARTPIDPKKLLDDIEAYNTHLRCERLLKYDGPRATPVEAFLELSQLEPLRSVPMRVRLFELWLRTEPKPRGGVIHGLNVDDEFGVLHWILKKNAADVLSRFVEEQRDALERFVDWLLEKARAYTKYFTGSYHYTSSVVYEFGRPRFAARIRLALEVEKAAIALGLTVPDDARLPPRRVLWAIR